ncbi:hypothetical protein GCM10027445_29600 [Amycolatopsis endophytica]|uniref:Uncharacterized protein n=1 Tax=Amycolatopsis endophytica TaxID=860233 RepID=A0A853BAY8_9PSEU|nr:hypothetical protein [Amycolatopsis endophytica]NYI91945.1 hypothetical protein [Amycolatopsis endophytica]
MPYQDLGAFVWPILVLIWVLAASYSRAAMHRRWHARTHPAPHRPPSRPVDAPEAAESLRALWDKARARYDRVAGEYGRYESDPGQVLRRPALADPAVPSTSRFIDAFHEAMALHTETYPPADLAKSYVRATENAEQTWRAACEAADKLRASRFTADERALINQGIKLLELAEGATTTAEQEAALAAARQVLGRLERSTGTRLDWRVPPPARQAIDRHGTPELPPA